MRLCFTFSLHYLFCTWFLLLYCQNALQVLLHGHSLLLIAVMNSTVITMRLQLEPLYAGLSACCMFKAPTSTNKQPS